MFDAPIFSTPFPPSPEDYLAEQEEVLSETVAGWGAKYPDVAVHHSVAHGHPAHALLKAALDADLLVVGSRGRRGIGVPQAGLGQ